MPTPDQEAIAQALHTVYARGTENVDRATVILAAEACAGAFAHEQGADFSPDQFFDTVRGV